jgi:hypothetical protein
MVGFDVTVNVFCNDNELMTKVFFFFFYLRCRNCELNAESN